MYIEEYIGIHDDKKIVCEFLNQSLFNSFLLTARTKLYGHSQTIQSEITFAPADNFIFVA